MPHEDGAAYAPVVATVSLGGALCLDISGKPSATIREAENSNIDGGPATENNHAPIPMSPTLPTRIFQEPRSLLITTGDAYRDLLHGISDIENDEHLSAATVANWHLLASVDEIEKAGGKNARTTRISLTYRDVLKVSLAASKVLGGVQRR